ncbi:MAG: amylosucrase [Clostridiales bacterium]|nr:amylosucrase [Clostridiales bacterium]
MLNDPRWEMEFAARFRSRADEMKWLFCELYHSDLEAFDAYVQMLYEAWQARPEALRESDRRREKDAAGYRRRDVTVMQMYAGAFAGTLRGVREKLDYIEECGVRCLHLMPLLESPILRSDGGYAVSDFRRVQPELGTMEDLRALTEACHEKGISVCLDFVMNHTSEDHEWARRAKAGEKEYQARYYFYDSWEIPNAYEQTVPQAFPTTAPGNFTWCGEAGKVVMTTFYPYEWDLNYMNPAVFRDMTDNMLFLCNQGADVIRLDAMAYIWKALGTPCRNLPQTHMLVRMLRLACETVCPGVLLLGEAALRSEMVSAYFGTKEKPECHLLYNGVMMPVLWHTVATRDTRLLAHEMRRLLAMPKEQIFLYFLRCHDDIAWQLDYGFLKECGIEEKAHKQYLNDYLTGKWPGSPALGEVYNADLLRGDARLCGTVASLCGVESARAGGSAADMEKALRLDITLHAFLFTLSGLPVIYSGDEFAQENDYAYYNDPLKAGDSRWLQRGDLDWRRAAQRGKKTTPAGKMFSALRRLQSARADCAAFDPDADVWLLDTGEDCVIGVGRYFRGEKVLAVFNFGDEEKDVWLRELESYTDMMTDKPRDAGAVTLPAGGFAWLRHTY